MCTIDIINIKYKIYQLLALRRQTLTVYNGQCHVTYFSPRGMHAPRRGLCSACVNFFTFNDALSKAISKSWTDFHQIFTIMVDI